MNNAEKIALETLLKLELSNIENTCSLSGIATQKKKDVFVQQLIDSMRRVSFVYVLKNREIAQVCSDPNSSIFDPLKAAIFHAQAGNLDEAYWLTFLAIYGGKHLTMAWNITKSIYGHLGTALPWTWDKVSNDPAAFSTWLINNHHLIQGSFGNHRKYESLKPTAPRSPSRVMESYVEWVGPDKSHASLIARHINEVGNDPKILFQSLYNSLDPVVSFGRTTKFDFLTMVAKLGLVDIEPGRTYMQGATGPVDGAKLLFGNNLSNSSLESKLQILEQNLSIGPMGMQVLEDALCNWQKSPSTYKLFRG